MSSTFPVVTMVLTEDEKESSLNEDVSRLSVDSSDSGPKQDKMKDSKEHKDSKFLKIRTSKKSEKNDPFRFEGEGMIIKAKLIGVDDVHSARGDKMCQDSMQMLKAVVKASGEHKQRVNLSISFQGVKIKDEKTGDVLYHHPVHLISFIAQDANDNRAFGYIYGSPQGGHKFIAIKTDKAASQAVIALRDLFEVVLAMKNAKKCSKDLGPLRDGEEDKQSLATESSDKDPDNGPQKVGNHAEKGQEHEEIYSAIGDEDGEAKTSTAAAMATNSITSPTLPSGIPQNSALIDLLDLDFEFETSPQPPKPPTPLATPFAFPAFQPEDPSIVTTTPAMQAASSEGSTSAWEAFSDTSPTNSGSSKTEAVTLVVPPASPSVTSASEDNRYACFSEIDSIPSVFENPLFVQPPPEVPPRPQSAGQHVDSPQPAACTPPLPSPPPKPPRSFNIDIFSELDPLGKDKPITNKNLFFAELKSPPKKSLKDLGGDVGNDMFGQTCASISTNVSNIFDANSSKFDASNMTNFHFDKMPAGNDPWNAFPNVVAKPFIFEANSDNAAVGPSPANQNKLLPLPLSNPFNPFQSDLSNEPPPPKTPPPPPPRPASATSVSLLPALPLRPPSRNSTAPTPPPPRRKPQPSPNMVNRNSDSDFYDHEGSRTGTISPPIPIPPRINGIESPNSIKSSNTTNSLGSESPISFGNNSNNASPRRENSSTLGQTSNNLSYLLFEKNGSGSGMSSSGYDSAPASASSRSSDSPNPFSPLPTPPLNHTQNLISNGHSEKCALPPPLPLPFLRPPIQQTPNHSSVMRNVDTMSSKSVASVDVSKSTVFLDVNSQSWKKDPFTISYNVKKLNGITPLYPETSSPDMLSPEERSIFRKNSDPFDDEFFNTDFKSSCNNTSSKSQNGQICGEAQNGDKVVAS